VVDLLVETPEGITLRRELAGAGTRTLAALIDLAIFGLAWLVVVLGLSVIGAGDATGLSRFALGLLVGGIFLTPAVYQIAFTLWLRGQTPGKKIVGVRAVDAQGGDATALQLVLRGLFWPVEVALSFPIPIALILMTATKRAQRLGDLIAGTVVVRERRRAAVAEPVPRQRWSELPTRRLPLVIAHAARLDARDLGLLRDLLSRTGIGRARLDRMRRRAARVYLRRLELEHVVAADGPSPREVLQELYLFLREARGDDPKRASRADPSRASEAAAPESAPAAAALPR